MGCCFSSPGEGPNSPYPGGGADDPAASSTRPINNSNNANAVTNARAQGTAACATAAASSAGTTSTSTAGPTSNSSGARQQHHHHQRRSRTHRHSQQPLSQHINKPLRRHTWASPSSLSTARRGAGAAANRRRWSRRAIDRERADFFDTRVAGRAEVWQALRAALEILWEADRDRDRAAAARRRPGPLDGGGGGGGEEEEDEGEESGGGRDDDDVALATAQSILDAGEITLPTGDLAQGAYDALGNYYALPEWIASDPSNMVPDGDDDDHGEKELDDDDLDDDLDGGMSSECTETEDEGEVVGTGTGTGTGSPAAAPRSGAEEKRRRHGRRGRREEKGKAVAHEQPDGDGDDGGGGGGEKDTVAVRARLSENGRDVVVRVGRGDHVRALERRVLDKAQLAPTAKIRIAYLGKILREHSSLASQGWQEGHIVNALVFHNS